MNTEQVRLLECWLPLAQELNHTFGWGASAESVAWLIQYAASALDTATNTEHARAILVLYYASRGTNSWQDRQVVPSAALK
jgi:hypothetical protein